MPRFVYARYARCLVKSVRKVTRYSHALKMRQYEKFILVGRAQHAGDRIAEMYKFQKTVIDYSHKTCIMKEAIDNVMNVANGTKVLLIDTFMNYFHVPSRGLPRWKFSETSSRSERHRRRMQSR
ncbi:uncharacterized protein LOC113004748 [Solenopsis invicta]|uniref:uncharacterized protein LOC113004748 n=1 Tax=Solenopsis invicta TaxID=13686 RepID=UPI000E33E626|nr:uncharacterized protein LOC113004748 [Solenopsis invicta]